MKFGEILHRADPALVVSPRHEAWMSANSDPVYSEEALEFGKAELAKQATPRDRRGTVSASSLGECVRKQQFTFLGLPEAPWTAKNAQKVLNGTFMHIRWQMAGLTEGWLAQAEVPVPPNPYHLAGTLDGIAYDGTIVELKSINARGFSGVQTFGPKPEHIMQVGTYMVATGISKSVIIYEDKNTQEYTEQVVLLDAELAARMEERSSLVWNRLDKEELEEPLSKCIDKEGWVYQYCPFRNDCLKIKNWEKAKELAHGR